MSQRNVSCRGDDDEDYVHVGCDKHTPAGRYRRFGEIYYLHLQGVGV